MNRENVQKVRDHIAGLAEGRFDMRYLIARGGQEYRVDRLGSMTALAKCGTAACIAGWTNALFSPSDACADIVDAADSLGLSLDDGGELFTPAGFLIPGRYTQAKAVAVLDHLLATGEVDWSATPGQGAA